MKKLTSFILITSLISSILAGCSDDKTTSANGEEDKVLQYQGSPGSVSFPELAEDLGYLGDLKLEYIGDSVGGPESIQLTATKQIDFGAAFNGAIIKSYSQNVKIKSVVGYYGSDENTYIGAYVLEGSPIKSAKDFIGKKVGVNILGAHLEFVTKDYLRQGGLTEKEIEQVTLVTVPAANAEQTLRNKQIDVVLLGGIARDRALETGGVEELFKDIDVFGAEFTAGDTFFTEQYIKDNPNTVKQFTEGVAKAIDWAQTTPGEEVIARFEKIINERGRKETADNLKFWKSTGIAEKGGVITASEYDRWIDWLVKSGELKEGQVKAEDLYTNEYNPFAK
ncbi:MULTISPECIES: ABC transporter substrate-binding protein [Bacillaceae]|uniref:ABC transporter substrate-binding protein n=1 Tax=Domibacillus aminovorans TaxID=29332 RepID=A0A177KZ76_9BACI|nr:MULTISPECIES: ABC transporter substrate-binding protein [Bacillaceae]OAH57841.1 ABC transporter substrate-binding protein [Domibacillus aminovorans]